MVNEIGRVLGSRHAVVAGAIGGAVALADGLLGPLAAPFTGLGAAAVTAWIGAQRVFGLASEHGVSREEALRVASEATRRVYGKNLAHKTLELARTVATRDPAAARAAGAVAFHCVRSQATSMVAHVLVGWSPPLFGSAKVIAASRAAYDAAAFVHAMEIAVTPPLAAAA